MKAIVHLGEPYWRSIDARDVEVTLPDRATLASLLLALVDQYPALAPDLRDGEVRPVTFVDEADAQPDTQLHDGSRIHIVWPVSGG